MNLIARLKLAWLNLPFQWEAWRMGQLQVGRQVLVLNDGAWHYGTVRQLPDEGETMTLVFYVDARGSTNGRWYEPHEIKLF